MCFYQTFLIHSFNKVSCSWQYLPDFPSRSASEGYHNYATCTRYLESLTSLLTILLSRLNQRMLAPQEDTGQWNMMHGWLQK